MKQSLWYVLILAAGLFIAGPVMANSGTCGVKDAHDHAQSAEAKQCPPDCAKECCAAKDDAAV